MIQISAIILPLALLLLAGYGSTASGLLARADWESAERISFRVLIPALIFHAISHSDLSMKASGPFVAALILVVVAMGLATWALRLAFRPAALPPQQLSTMIQAATRWNALIVLPVAFDLFDSQGLATVAIAMAFLIPLIQVGNIVVVSLMHSTTFEPRRITGAILRNPLVIASVLGLAVNGAGLALPAAVDQSLLLLRRSALAVGILCIGAAFEWRRLLRPTWQVLWGVLLKNIAAPGLFFVLARLLGLGPVETICGMLVVSAPAATNGYIVTRQMGGDGPLYAYTMSWQLVLSMLSIPAIILLGVPG